MLAYKKTMALACLLAANLTRAITLYADECCTPTCCVSTCCEEEGDSEEKPVEPEPEPVPEDFTDNEDPSDFCCFFYKNANFWVEEPDEKLILCAMSTNYGLVPYAVGLPTHDEWMHFDNEMESYKCGSKVEAHICGGVFNEEIIRDEATGHMAMNFLCSEETLDMIDAGERADLVTYENEMSGVIINPVLSLL